MLSTYKTSLVKKKQLTSNIYFFTFKPIDPPEINFIPGQYLILKVQGKPRPYSIASSNLDKNKLEFIIELFPGGLASTYLDSLKIGNEVDFQGPIGQFTVKENNKQKIFLVTGTGIAPVRSILKNFKFQISNFKLFWGLKTYRDVYLFEDLKKYNLKICLSREENLDMISEFDRKFFNIGHVDSCFYKLVTNHQSLITNYEFYLCGGRNVVESLQQSLLSKNVPSENIVFEKF